MSPAGAKAPPREGALSLVEVRANAPGVFHMACHSQVADSNRQDSCQQGCCLSSD